MVAVRKFSFVFKFDNDNSRAIGAMNISCIFTYLLTYSLTPWWKIFFEKLIVIQLVKR